jgi:hypothetical protein
MWTISKEVNIWKLLEGEGNQRKKNISESHYNTFQSVYVYFTISINFVYWPLKS